MSQTTRIKPTLSGIAVVCCVHDREKRQVTTEAQIAQLGLALDPPVIYNPAIHRIYICSCCQNLFVADNDEPMYCNVCRSSKIKHAPAAPLNEPTGPIS